MLTCQNISLEDNLSAGEELIKESQTATFFQTPEWLFLWVKHFGPSTSLEVNGKVQVIGLYEEEKLIGIAPLIVKDETIELLGTGKVLGGEFVTDFGDITAKTSCEETVWREVLAEIQNPKSQFQIKSKIQNPKIQLNFIREDSVSFEILKNLGGRIEEVDVAPYIDLPKTWEEYLALLEKKNRHELRRKIRRLEEEGAFKVCHEGEPTDIDEFFRLMILSNEQKRDFLSEKMKDFFRDIFAFFWPKKMIRLCFLKLEGENIASVLLFDYNNEFLLYNSGFDPKHANLSPGLLLKAFVIKQAIEEGKKRFEFLRGSERYKFDLGARGRKLYRLSFN